MKQNMKWYLCANYHIFLVHFQDLRYLHMTFPFLLTVYWIFAFQPAEEKGNLHWDLTVIHTAINFSPLTYFSCNLYLILPKHPNKQYILFFFMLKSPHHKSLFIEHQVEGKVLHKLLSQLSLALSTYRSLFKWHKSRSSCLCTAKVCVLP